MPSYTVRELGMKKRKKRHPDLLLLSLLPMDSLCNVKGVSVNVFTLFEVGWFLLLFMALMLLSSSGKQSAQCGVRKTREDGL